MKDKKEHILNTISDTMAKMFYYDRKEDEDLGTDGFEDAIKAGEITYHEILSKILEEVAFLRDIKVDIVPFVVEEEKHFKLKYTDFDKLVNQHIDGIDNYEVVAYEELNNDSSNKFSGTGIFVEYEEEELLDISKRHFKANIYLNQLVRLGVLPAGDYLIEVNW